MDTDDALELAMQSIQKHVTRLGQLEQKFKQEDQEQRMMRDSFIASSTEEGRVEIVIKLSNSSIDDWCLVSVCNNLTSMRSSCSHNAQRHVHAV